MGLARGVGTRGILTWSVAGKRLWGSILTMRVVYLRPGRQTLPFLEPAPGLITTILMSEWVV